MELGIALIIIAACGALARVRSLAYGAYFLSYLPFLSLHEVHDGMQSMHGLGASSVQAKLAVRSLCAFVFLVLLARQRQSLAFLAQPRHAALLALLGWSFFGVWQSASPWLSLFRLVELCSFFLAGVALYLESGRFHPLRKVLRWHCLALWSLPLIAIAYQGLRPDLAAHTTADQWTRWGHKLLNANSLGFASTVVLLWVTSAWQSRDREVSPWLLAGAGLSCAFVLLQSHSRTALLALLVGQAILWWPERRRVAAGAMGLLAAAGWLALTRWEVWQAWLLRGDSVGDLQSATGRTPLWGALMRDQVTEAPLTGFGYLMLSAEGGFWHAGREWTNAHNSYLYALVSAGWVGLVLLLACLGQVWTCAWRRACTASPKDRPAATLLLALFSVIALTSITGFGIYGHPNPAMLLFFTLYALGTSPLPATPCAPQRVAHRTPIGPWSPQTS